MHVLFVCTGNVCRSPLAERIAIAHAAQRAWADFSAFSAGTRAMVGHEMDPTAARVLQSLGGRPDGFRARRLTEAIVRDADLVLTMTESHRAAVLSLAPTNLRTTFTLAEANRLVRAGATSIDELAGGRALSHPVGKEDIPDPMRADEQTHLAVGSLIADLLIPVLDVINSY